MLAFYGGLLEPHYGRVGDVYEHNPYSALIEELRGRDLEISESTDINCDVCFSCFLESEPKLSLYLLMVGSFSILGESAREWTRLIDIVDLTTTGSSDIGYVRGTLLRHEVQLLSRTDLDEQTPLRISSQPAKVFQSLFFPEESLEEFFEGTDAGS